MLDEPPPDKSEKVSSLVVPRTSFVFFADSNTNPSNPKGFSSTKSTAANCHVAPLFLASFSTEIISAGVEPGFNVITNLPDDMVAPGFPDSLNTYSISVTLLSVSLITIPTSESSISIGAAIPFTTSPSIEPSVPSGT